MEEKTPERSPQQGLPPAVKNHAILGVPELVLIESASPMADIQGESKGLLLDECYTPTIYP